MLHVTNKFPTLISPLLKEIPKRHSYFPHFAICHVALEVSFHSSFLLHSHSPLSWRFGFLFFFNHLFHVFSLSLFLFIQFVRYFTVFLETFPLWCVWWCIIINSSTSNSRMAFFLFWYSIWWWMEQTFELTKWMLQKPKKEKKKTKQNRRNSNRNLTVMMN